MSSPAKRIGIYGGSFDPVHNAHLLVARAAIEEMHLDRLYFVPAAQSPFKPGVELAPAADRLMLLRLALAGETQCEVDPMEITRGGISYTIDTVRAFRQRDPAAHLFYLIGGDNARLLNTWREANELAKRVEFIVIPRPGEAHGILPAPFKGHWLNGFPFALSSSQIRERVKARLPVDRLVPPQVAEAIRNKGLYL